MKLLEVNINYIAKLLSAALPRTDVIPSVRFYEGIDGLKKILEETLHANGELLVFDNFVHFAELFDSEYLFDYFKRRAQHQINTKVILPEGKWNKILKERADEYKLMMRLSDTHADWRAGMMIWNNEVALTSHTEGKITSTIIENGDVSFFFKKIIFESLWNTARPLNGA